MTISNQQFSINNQKTSRRDFVKASALAGGGLLLSALFPTRQASAATQAATVFKPNFFIKIDTQGLITLVSKNPEIGQGIKTSLPMIIAEDLEAPWENVSIEQAGFVKGLPGWQGAGGSGATPGHYMNFRKIGAVGRTMLEQAAAQKWSVNVDECRADQGYVKHAKSKKKLAFKDLVDIAATLEAPSVDSVKLKDPKNFKLLGKRIGGVDNHSIVTGAPIYGIDEQHEGLLYASYVRCPVFGGKPRTANLDTIKQMTGVVDAFQVEGSDDIFGLVPGIAIIAQDTWTAFKAQQSLQIIWDEPAANEENSLLYREKAQALASEPGKQRRSDGDVDTALSNSSKVLEASYEYPFLSHTNLEPQNTTAVYKDGVMEIWSPTQNPGDGHGRIKEMYGLEDDNVVIHMTRIGGGFGRRLVSDFMCEAAAIAHKLEGTPVKLTWTREQDMKHDYYRAAGWHHFKGAVKDGKISAWSDHFVTLGLNTDEKPGRGANMGGDEFPYRFVDNARLSQTILPTNVPMSWWRAPGSCSIAWAIQSFIDELAVEAKSDPLQFRLDLLGPDRPVKPSGKRGVPYDTARMKGVLNVAAEKAGWGKKLPKGSGQGIAFHFSHRGYVAVVASVTVDQSGSLKVDKLVAGVDVGPVINMSGAENQVHGSMLDALNAAWQQEITIEGGQVRQSNFDDNAMLRISQSPKTEAHFIQSDNPPTGLGEPAFPPTTPAITNAIYAATGVRVRTLPLSKTDLSWS
ncbi:xanthine dehydrogenase family protein molybdopterin-binding subunit [Pelagicoccus mobilis]|uniref:Xanthine dehydrogenase family protein molybdopterin-binding subunit n=1 Tax=Pelagicoccus mobilis TaxID=415221 RepID=A0A934RW78_9BACT|nr:molybdopterin cofactor-binding domain-containing protein [Pelagicoccus mobilis]MBK1876615.1 xanthine dehydrogenase family protein molybdopterin-binding subunit [Pelagicoccus mobilis]